VADMTFAEKAARTVELDAEMRALWPGVHVTSAIHNLSHEDVHEGTKASACWIQPQSRWSISGPLAGRYDSPDLYGTADDQCSTCQALIAEAQARGEDSRVD